MIITELVAGLSVATKAAFGISMATTVEAITPFSFPDAGR